ncbi:hypothetical protein LshimejAT787_1200850 [Lyophyllum shimeji]|uniref:Uncharacterized protein n=1 Tax=Lyophyllum shimeji TaxID=47721 RepID=A0A9P3PVX5_LYOSH|nr:hypothetical protein LshimejAT787_1200850 [Lyophyllum shimeji]
MGGTVIDLLGSTRTVGKRLTLFRWTFYTYGPWRVGFISRRQFVSLALSVVAACVSSQRASCAAQHSSLALRLSKSRLRSTHPPQGAAMLEIGGIKLESRDDALFPPRKPVADEH